ncbi:hypothetical protein ACFOEY_09390 [Paracandidimonas soli]|uniref:hypothetical protein n=1 Tax=Paracandidimonas soli TaxID=1917182 RepID=UPI003606D303
MAGSDPIVLEDIIRDESGYRTVPERGVVKSYARRVRATGRRRALQAASISLSVPDYLRRPLDSATYTPLAAIISAPT